MSTRRYTQRFVDILLTVDSLESSHTHKLFSDFYEKLKQIKKNAMEEGASTPRAEGPPEECIQQYGCTHYRRKSKFVVSRPKLTSFVIINVSFFGFNFK